ncbi:MAG: tetratricopeptide repeat protein, partial [Planctomycetota bacterium]
MVESRYSRKASPGERPAYADLGLGEAALPPVWRDLAARIAGRWQVPVFVLGVAALCAYLLLRPEGERVRPWEDYMRDAARAFTLAVRAQDERGDAERALKYLWRERVPELAAARTLSLPESLPEEVRNVDAVHGVLPSYHRVILQGGEEVLGGEDLARIGESYYRLGIIKREHADGIGGTISLSARELCSEAERYLTRALEDAARPAAGPGVMARPREESELERPEWRRRRRMRAECYAFLGEYKRAIEDLEALMSKMNAAAVRRLRAEMDPRGGSASRTGGERWPAAADESAEWARVYELLARCHDRLNQHGEAVRYYRLFLELELGGELTHRVRLRLSELLMQEVVAGGERDADAVLAEIEALCGRVEQSDAPAGLREDATFLRGRAAYRRGGLAADPGLARAAYSRAAGAFAHSYSPSRHYLAMSHVLRARSLFFSGSAAEAEEIVEGLLRMGARPAIYACAEVSMADMRAESEPVKAVGGLVNSAQRQLVITPVEAASVPGSLGLRVADLERDGAAALGLERGGARVTRVVGDGPARVAGIREGDVLVRLGRGDVSGVGDLLRAGAQLNPGTAVTVTVLRPDEEAGLKHGYIDAIARIRRIPAAERQALAPELAELLDDDHFVMRCPEPAGKIPPGKARLVRIARAHADLREYDEAARIYEHILRAYPGVCRDRYSYLLGELYAAKAAHLKRLGSSGREQRRALLAAARAFLQVPLEEQESRFAADAYWHAGSNYFAARRYDGASRALDVFVRRFGDDPRLSEGLYLLGESLRRMGDLRRAAAFFRRC